MTIRLAATFRTYRRWGRKRETDAAWRDVSHLPIARRRLAIDRLAKRSDSRLHLRVLLVAYHRSGHLLLTHAMLGTD